ncbi:MAG: type VI secretion system ATPase TssH [Deltaproteobacteria bacterium]|nr:type VI secretion system ATPase TssH [Deltaproteobacteria bacterium]
MSTVDIRQLLEKMNDYCRVCLEQSASSSFSKNHYEITVEHFLLEMVEEKKSDVSLILDYFDIGQEDFKSYLNRTLGDFKTGNGAKPVLSPLLVKWMKDAYLSGSIDLQEDQIRSGTLFAAFVNTPSSFSGNGIANIIEPVKREVLLENFNDIVSLSFEQKKDGKKKKALPESMSASSKFCEDFTKKAAEGKIDPVFGRDAEVRQMIDVLARRKKNNPIVVGEAGVGKTAVVEGLALRIVENDVPDFLKDVSILSLDMGLLQAGAGVKGEFENRLKNVIEEVKASEKPIILFIDEAHTLIGAGGSKGGSDAANLLKPALARGELRTIAATTWPEYKQYFEKDAALSRRFQPVKLDEPSVETAVMILRGLRDKYEGAHRVVIRDDAINAAAKMSDRFISGRYMPDKAIDLMDTSAARVKVLLSAKPGVIEDLDRKIEAKEREITILERDMIHGEDNREALDQAITDLEKYKEKLNPLMYKWENERNTAADLIDTRERLYKLKTAEEEIDELNCEVLKTEIEELKEKLTSVQGDSPLIQTEVTVEIVAKIVSDWTGIPTEKILNKDTESITELSDKLKKRIKGQDIALKEISETIGAAKAGLTDPDQPMGVFLLAGPSGTGKTETGLSVAEEVFGGERFTVSVNMSEFQEKHTVSRLIGSPPGYVGYGEGGVLTETVRQRPYSVVLLDEVEKADPEVLNLFYQVFDKGVLSDGEGREIDFKNTVIFMTSNLASDIISDICAKEENPDKQMILDAIKPVLSDHFKPALLARMHIVPYKTLPENVIRDISEIKLSKLTNRLKDTHGINLSVDSEVTKTISERCLEVDTGARNIDHILKGSLLPILSQEILELINEKEIPEELKLVIGEGGSFKIEHGNLK